MRCGFKTTVHQPSLEQIFVAACFKANANKLARLECHSLHKKCYSTNIVHYKFASFAKVPEK
jgi:hypothetical protein